MTELTQIQSQILDTIDVVRAEHHACTAGRVSALLGVSKQWVVDQCTVLKNQGLVDWTDMHGSLHRVHPTLIDAADQAWAELIVQPLLDKMPEVVDESMPPVVFHLAQNAILNEEQWETLLGPKPTDSVGAKIWNGRKGALIAKQRKASVL
jgi:hypothetical protein